MNDRIAIDLVDAGDDALLELYFEATRMLRKTERANLEKKPSTRLSQEPCLGVKVNSKQSVAWRRPLGARARNVPSIVQYPDRSSPIRPHTAILPSHQSSSSQ